jgi:WD40 repeat protein
VVANLHDSVDIYGIPNMQLIKSYLHGNTNNTIFKVSFIDSDWLISGGQDGFACLYDVQSGQCLEKLDHGSGT